jgi:hypothetical protein
MLGGLGPGVLWQESVGPAWAGDGDSRTDGGQGHGWVTGEPTVRATARFHALQRKGTACAFGEGLFDPLADDIFLAVDAVQVDLVQDAGAVAGLS